MKYTRYYFCRYLTRPSDENAELSLPEGYDLRMFVPKWPHISPPGLERGSFSRILCAWWLMRTVGVFRNRRGYKICTIHKDNMLIHYSVVLPWHRKYGFMGKDDYQIGPVGTSEHHRRKGLATLAMMCIKKEFAESGAYLWYITRTENVPSIKSIEKSGFERFAVGVRETTLGLRLLARFKIESVLV